MENRSVFSNRYITLLIGSLVFLGLYLINYYHNLLFHCLVEIFSIIVACGIFMIIWNTRQFQDNNYFIFIGIGYLFIGGLDLFYSLVFPGLNIFQNDINLPAQLWIASRYVESISMLIAPLIIRRKFKINYLFPRIYDGRVLFAYINFKRKYFSGLFY